MGARAAGTGGDWPFTSTGQCGQKLTESPCTFFFVTVDITIH